MIDTSISSRAMKFKLMRGGVRRSARDKDAEEVIKSLKGDEGQIVSRKLFLNKNSPVQKYQQKANEMYQYHVANTLPCGDDATRLLKNSIYFEYTSKMQQFISELESLKQKIVGSEAIYMNVVTDDVMERNAALAAQGKPATATPDDYLSFDEMERRLYVTWYPEPISTSGDFRFEIPDEMRTRCDEQLDQMLREAKADIYVRMLAPMKAFVEKLSVPIGEDGSVFRNTLVSNVADLVEHLPRLNLDDDSQVTEAINALRDAIMPYSGNPDTLRESPAVRSKAKADVEKLMAQLSGGYGT